MVIGIIALAIILIPFWFICKKAGFSPWLALLNIIPLGNLVLHLRAGLCGVEGGSGRATCAVSAAVSAHSAAISARSARRLRRARTAVR